MVQANHTNVVRWVHPKIFGFDMVSCFRKRNVGIREFSSIETKSRHTFTRVVYVIGYTKCTQTPKILPYQVLIICQGIPGRHPPFFDLWPFFSLCLPAFSVPLSILFARKFCLLESLFLDENLNQRLFLDEYSNQIDSLYLHLIFFILCDGSSIGWVVVAVADASSIGWVALAVSMVAAVAVLAVQKIAMPLLFDGWWLRWRSKRSCTVILWLGFCVFFCLTLNSPDAIDIVHCTLFLCSICRHGLSQPLSLVNFLAVGAI